MLMPRYTGAVLGSFEQALPRDAFRIVLVLFLSFLVGLEREEHKTAGAKYAFGGVRTFPLIGLVGYATAYLSGDQVMPIVVGLVVVAGFLWISYWHKLQATPTAGVTSEISALATYLAGALVARDAIWVATALSVSGAFLLELKSALEGLTRRIASEEIRTFTTFLLLTAVILPVLPNQEFGPFRINPFHAWLVVVAVSSVSYGSYVIQQLLRGQGGVVLAAVLGGAYSSTVTTVVMGRLAAREARPHLLSGATLMASGMMYLRLAVLVGLFNQSLLAMLGIPFLVLAAAAIGAGWIWSRRSDGRTGEAVQALAPRNPLEIGAASLFALLFVAMLIATQMATTYLGHFGLYSLAAVMGVTDVDPFIMGLTQAGGRSTELAAAAVAILIAASSNNFIKGIYAFALSDRRTGIMSLALLVALAVAGLVPLAWVWGV
jgi:uncharacterized membrane protein (DUF4010 family)